MVPHDVIDHALHFVGAATGAAFGHIALRRTVSLLVSAVKALELRVFGRVLFDGEPK